MPQTIQREHRNYCHHRRLRYRSRNSIMAETNGDLKPIRLASRYLNDAEKNIRSKN